MTVGNEIQQIVPSPPSEEQVQRTRAKYEIWRDDYAAKLRSYGIRNIRFIHDPKWRERFWSLTNVRESMAKGPTTFGGVFWVYIVAPLFALGGAAFGIGLFMQALK